MIALMTQRYMAMRGLTEEKAARVVVRSRRNAINNPYAHLKGQITVDDVMNSRPVSTPYKLFDICPRSSGACAVVLACEEVAREKCAQPAFVHGIGGIANTVFMGDRNGPAL
jgi:acetyl-CoA C-acetyltransferase